MEDTIRNTSYCDCPDGYEGINCESAICKSCCLQFLGILLSINTDACTALFFCAISHHFALGNPPCSDVGGVCIANRCECFCGWTGEYCNIQGRKKIQSGAMYIYIYIYLICGFRNHSWTINLRMVVAIILNAGVLVAATGTNTVLALTQLAVGGGGCSCV